VDWDLAIAGLQIVFAVIAGGFSDGNRKRRVPHLLSHMGVLAQLLA
jgi:hypothetical protein